MTEPSLPDRLRAYDPARPDPGLRDDLLRALGWEQNKADYWSHWWRTSPDLPWCRNPTPFSLDFAFSQIPPGWVVEEWGSGGGGSWYCILSGSRRHSRATRAPHPAVALLLAILAAREIDAAAAEEATP